MQTPLPPDAPPVSPARFRDLAAGSPKTAAAHLPLVIYRDVIDAAVASVTHHHLDFLSLYIVRHGRGTHVIDGVPYAVSRGDVYAMGVGMAHFFRDCEDLATDTLHFSPEFFDAAAVDALAQTPGFQSLFVHEPLRRRETSGAAGRWLHLTPDAYAQVAAMVAELRAEWLSGTPSGTLLTRGLFLRLLVWLARRYAEAPPQTSARSESAAAPPTPHEATVAAAVGYLDEHFAEPVRIEQLALSVFLSPDHFTRVFAQAMGRTPSDYLRHLRLERAKALLRDTDVPVSEVAQRSGFSEAAYFVRTFRAATGLTPRQWRHREAT